MFEKKNGYNFLNLIIKCHATKCLSNKTKDRIKLDRWIKKSIIIIDSHFCLLMNDSLLDLLEKI